MLQTKPTSSTIPDFRRRHNLPESTFWDYVAQKRIKLTYLGKRNPRILDEDERAFLAACRRTHDPDNA